jgi:hypothetical protein
MVSVSVGRLLGFVALMLSRQFHTLPNCCRYFRFWLPM